MESLFFLEIAVKNRQGEIRDSFKQLRLEQSLSKPKNKLPKVRLRERFLMTGGDLLISFGLKLKSYC